MSDDEACVTCRYWRNLGRDKVGDLEGYCRRRAPQAWMGPDNRSERPQWPLTGADDWCGEWEARG